MNNSKSNQYSSLNSTRAPDTMGGCANPNPNAEKRTPLVISALDNLEKQCADVSDLLKSLFERLQPVLRSEEKDDTKYPIAPPLSYTTVYDKINMRSSELTTLVLHLQEIHRLLEL